MSQVPVNKLLTLGVAASGSAIATAFFGQDVAGSLAGAAGGILQSLIAGSLQPWIDRKSESPESLIINQDLRRLVGDAIHDTILLHDSDSPLVKKLASGAIDLWTSEATASDTNYSPLDETSVVELFNTPSMDFSNLRALDIPTWKRFIDTLVLNGSDDIPESLRDRLATSLYERLPQMLRGKLKQDFEGNTETKGRGFASLHLAMMGRLLQCVDALLNRPQEADALQRDLLEQLKQFNSAVPERADRQSKRFAAVPGERAAVSRLMEQINLLKPCIEHRLNEILRAVAAEGEKSRHRDLTTHNRLAWVLLGVVAGLPIMFVVYMTQKRLEVSQQRTEISQERMNAQLQQFASDIRTRLLTPAGVGNAPVTQPLPPALIEKANILLERGNKEQRALAESALGHYDKADELIQEIKKDSLADTFRLFSLEGDNCLRAKQWARATEAYERAIVLQPANLLTVYQTAAAHFFSTAGSREAHLRRAIELLTRVLAESRESDLVFRARAHTLLGCVWVAYPIGDKNANLTKAIESLEAAATEVRPETHPVEWGLVQYNLGIAYRRLSSDGGQNEMKGIAAFEAALPVYAHEKLPFLWAVAQSELGATWGSRSTGDRDEKIDKAVAAFDAALTVLTPKTEPVALARTCWAQTQCNLGNALRYYSKGNHEANLRRAISACKAALTVFRRETDPVEWAITQSNLGGAWFELSTGNSDANLKNAIAAFDAALTVFTRETNRNEWARTQMELGTAWLRLTKGEQGEKSRKAIAALEKALTVFTAESEPLRWVLTQMDLGCAWSNLPDGDHDSNLKKAIAAYERAVMVNRDTTNTNVTNAWSLALMNLGSARSEMFTRSGDGENLLKAIAAYDAALSVFNRGTPATLFATAHVRRAACFLVMSELPGQEGGPLLRRAAASIKAALAVYTVSDFPKEHAAAMDTQRAIRRAYESGGYEKETRFDAIEPAGTVK